MGSSPLLSLRLCLRRRNSCRQTQSPRPRTARVGPCPSRRDCRAPGAGSLHKTWQGQVSQRVRIAPSKRNAHLPASPGRWNSGCWGYRKGAGNTGRLLGIPIKPNSFLQKHLITQGVPYAYMCCQTSACSGPAFWLFIRVCVSGKTH